MRIISQNGNYDLPYESSDVIVEDESIIAISSPIPRLMAEYKSVEKAQKAMDMLHQEYTGVMPSLKINMDDFSIREATDELMKFSKNATVSIYRRDGEVHMLPRVFRFPEDDEIEVSNE